jgi:hypothetical protein
VGGHDRRLDVARGTFDVAVHPESQLNIGVADRAVGRHVIDVRDRTQMTLQRRRDCRGHALGAGAGEGGLHEDRGDIDLGQRRHWKHREGCDATQCDTEGEQYRRHRPRDERRRDVHAG